MLIINNAVSIPHIEVKDMPAGEVFMVADNTYAPSPEDLYMVCTSMETKQNSGVKTVYLSSGLIYNFSKDTKVIRVPGAFVIGARS